MERHVTASTSAWETVRSCHTFLALSRFKGRGDGSPALANGGPAALGVRSGPRDPRARPRRSTSTHCRGAAERRAGLQGRELGAASTNLHAKRVVSFSPMICNMHFMTGNFLYNTPINILVLKCCPRVHYDTAAPAQQEESRGPPLVCPSLPCAPEHSVT